MVILATYATGFGGMTPAQRSGLALRRVFTVIETTLDRAFKVGQNCHALTSPPHRTYDVS